MKRKGENIDNEEQPEGENEEQPKKKMAKRVDNEEQSEGENDDVIQIIAPKKQKAKRVKRVVDPNIEKVETYTRDDFELPKHLSEKDEPLRGLRFAVAGTLITREEQGHTFFLCHEELQKLIVARGGTFGAVSGKTDIFIEGDMEREASKSKPDAWSGSSKQVALAIQLAKEDPPFVMTFNQFMSQFNIEEPCYMSSNIARFDEAVGSKKYKATGVSRNRGCLFSKSLTWTSGMNQGESCKPKHNKYLYPFRAQLPKLGKDPLVAENEEEDENDYGGYDDCG